MANPFKKITKNAIDSKKDWGGNKTSKTKTRKCEGCGAARPKDTNLITCDYCGFHFMTIDNEIKPDN
jgi:DNA-directed RNA polymerase subunit RPC12/RpoP